MDVREYFPELDALDATALHLRRSAILDRTGGDHKALDDDSLAELVQITRCLRRKSGASGGAPRASKKKTAVPANGVDDLV